MRKVVILLFIIGSLAACHLIACNSNSNSNQAADVKPTNDSVAVALQCYAYMQNKDTVRLHIAITNNTFTGHMLYQIYGKDRNEGTLHGTILGDTLIADYTFSSEGMVSVRQVAFLKLQNNLKEGFGELKIKNNQWHLQTRKHYNSPVLCLRQH